MRTIILAAGQGYRAGGYNKMFLRNPITNATIMDSYLDIFNDTEITVVVGYKAVNIMSRYPKFQYIFNKDWNIYKDSYSLGLALNEEPTYVIHSDMFIDKNVRKVLDKDGENCVVTINRDSRNLSAHNCSLDGMRIKDIYQGEVRNPNDPELLGIYKVIQKEALQYWKRNCLEHRYLYMGQNFPIHENITLNAVNGNDLDIKIIKTPIDYINYLNLMKSSNR